MYMGVYIHLYIYLDPAIGAKLDIKLTGAIRQPPKQFFFATPNHWHDRRRRKLALPRGSCLRLCGSFCFGREKTTVAVTGFDEM